MRKHIHIDTEALGTLNVRKLPPWKYYRFIKALQDVIQRSTGGGEIGRGNAVVLFTLLTESYSTVTEIMATSTGKTTDEMGSLDPVEAIEILAAIVKLNKFKLS